MQGQQHQGFSITFIYVFTVSANLVPRGPSQSENSQAVAGQLLTPQVRENRKHLSDPSADPTVGSTGIQGVGREVQ